MDVLGVGHLAAAIAAMSAGAVVLLSRKGTRWHRRWGWLYVGSMLAINATALMIYDLFGGFGPFHAAALVSLGTVAMGMVPVRQRAPRGRWLPMHAYWMSGSYVGLLAAFVSESATRYFDYDFGNTVIAATVVVSGVGVALMLVRVPVAMRNVGKRSPTS